MIRTSIILPAASDALSSAAVADLVGTLQQRCRNVVTRYQKLGIQGAQARDFAAIGYIHSLGHGIMTQAHGFYPILVDGHSARLLGHRLIDNPVLAVRGLARSALVQQNVLAIERDAAYVIRALTAAAWVSDGSAFVAPAEVARAADCTTIRVKVRPGRSSSTTMHLEAQ